MAQEAGDVDAEIGDCGEEDWGAAVALENGRGLAAMGALCYLGGDGDKEFVQIDEAAEVGIGAAVSEGDQKGFGEEAVAEFGVGETFLARESGDDDRCTGVGEGIGEDGPASVEFGGFPGGCGPRGGGGATGDGREGFFEGCRVQEDEAAPGRGGVEYREDLLVRKGVQTGQQEVPAGFGGEGAAGGYE